MKPCLFNFFRSCQYGFWPRSANRARRLHNATTARTRLRYFLAGLAILLVASVCDAQTRQELATLKGHDDVVYSVVFSPDGKTLASGSYDNTVKLWDAQSRRELATLKGHAGGVHSVVFSPDGKTLASGSEDSTIKLWDAQTGRELATLKGHDKVVYSVAFSPDGKTLASGSYDDTVKLWDAQTGQELATLKGHVDRVSSVAFSALAKAAPRSDVVEWASVPRSMRETHSPTCTEPSAPD